MAPYKTSNDKRGLVTRAAELFQTLQDESVDVMFPTETDTQKNQQ